MEELFQRVDSLLAAGFFLFMVTQMPEFSRVFSHRERKRAVWLYGRVGKKARREIKGKAAKITNMKTNKNIVPQVVS